jgi:hypothetical protein
MLAALVALPNAADKTRSRDDGGQKDPSRPWQAGGADARYGGGGYHLRRGVELVKKGLAEPVGSLTQLSTIRLGKRTENRVPKMGEEVIHHIGLDYYE